MPAFALSMMMTVWLVLLLITALSAWVALIIVPFSYLDYLVWRKYVIIWLLFALPTYYVLSRGGHTFLLWLVGPLILSFITFFSARFFRRAWRGFWNSAANSF